MRTMKVLGISLVVPFVLSVAIAGTAPSTKVSPHASAGPAGPQTIELLSGPLLVPLGGTLTEPVRTAGFSSVAIYIQSVDYGGSVEPLWRLNSTGPFVHSLDYRAKSGTCTVDINRIVVCPVVGNEMSLPFDNDDGPIGTITSITIHLIP